MNEEESIKATEAEMKALGLEPTPAEEKAEEKSPEVAKPEAEKPEVKADVSDDKKSVEAAKVEPEKVEPESKQVSVRDLKKGYKETIKKLEEEVAKLRAKPSDKQEEKVERLKISLDERAKKLAEKLNFDPAKTKAILEEALEAARDEVPRESLSEEDRKAIQSVKEREIQLEQQEIFNEEWGDIELNLKTQFPNASVEQIAKARGKMKELAYKAENLDKEMDYILYKEKKSFDELLFSPKQKTFESGKAPLIDDKEGELEDFNPDWTPARVEQWEKKRDALMEESPKSKVRIVSNGIERWE